MIAEAIQKILDVGSLKQFTLHGIEYADRELKLIPPPQAPSFQVHTLDGFVNMLEAGIDGFDPAHTAIHVDDFESVSLVHRRATPYGKRIVSMAASPVKGVTGFAFNTFTDQEIFVIGLQSHFQPSNDLTYLLDIASHITALEKVILADNGHAQETTLQRSAARKENVEVRSRLSLKPFRTFRELDQPASDFIFRIHEGPKLAIIEADGGAWKIAAIGAIAGWLRHRIDTSAVAGLADLPIIS